MYVCVCLLTSVVMGSREDGKWWRYVVVEVVGGVGVGVGVDVNG